MLHNRTVYVVPDEFLPTIKEGKMGLPKSTSTKGAARTPVPPPRNAPTQQTSQNSSSMTTSSKTELAGKKASITPSTTLPSKDQDNTNKKPPNICQKLLSNCVGRSKSCMECCKKGDNKDDKDKEKEKKEKRKDENFIETAKDESNKEKKSILNKLKCKCCDKNADDDKKDEDKKHEDKKSDDKGSLTQNKNDSQSSGLFSCCKKKNRIGDSSSTSTMKSGEKAGCCSWLKCCKSQKQKEEEWAQRRDSILSQPPPARSRWCACLPCCKPRPIEELSSSRRASLFSKNKSMSPTLPPEDTRPKLDVSLVEHSSIMRGAIPVLPILLAYFCLICNVLVPGLGTIFSGTLCLCFGKPRFSVHDGPKQRIGAFIINLFIGAGQLFTVLFCLVGWGWSIWWGTIMLKVAKKYRKLKELAANEDVEQAPVVTSQNHHGRPANGMNA